MAVMKLSPSMPLSTKLRRLASVSALAVALAAGFAIDGAGMRPAAADTTTQYQPWQGSNMQKLLAELKAKIAQAEADQAASPDFLADLKALQAKYEALAAQQPAAIPAAIPAGTVLLSDTFADGNYASNPTWKVSAGQWNVEVGGKNYGLVSKIRPQKVNVNSILGAILAPQGQTQTTQSEFASIYTAAKITNAFTLKVKLTSKDKQGALNMGVYQGASGNVLYRMVYQPGASPGLSIQRVSAQGATTIAAYNGGINLEDGKAHNLVLTRDKQGKMTLTLDGQLAAQVVDTTLQGDFAGVLLINTGGAYWLREVTVTAG
jgi:hypothetical protein